MSNRLAQETSPYLLQHKDNPVDWYPWGPEALALAREEDKPILLSVGYSACHWCHVMERESFEDDETAAYMNEHFVNVKVDREERPDVDAIYMEAVQAISGHGGWPMTVFLDPDGVPFYGGTYFPPDESRGMPSFRMVMEAVVHAFETKREEIRERAPGTRARLGAIGEVEPRSDLPGADQL
nr:thioredoxin domain-containing protein [Actinomycetota bacterium]